MLLRTTRGDVEVANLFETSSVVPSWTSYAGADAWSGVTVNRSTAVGLPAVAAAIRVISETIGSIPVIVWEGDPVERERARDSWQWELLHEAPSPDQSAFDFFQDISTSIESTGDAFVWKMKVRTGRVEALYVVDPAIVVVRRNGANKKVFDVTVEGKTTTYSSTEILHIRGWALSPGADRGASPITLHRHALGSALAVAEFEGRFYRNGAAPSGVISHEGDLKKEVLDSYRQQFDDRQAGLENAGKPLVLYNGATWETMGISLADAQFVQSKRFNISDVARMFRISPRMLDQPVGSVGTTSDDIERFLKVDLASRLRRIEAAFRADPDLFTGDLFPEFLTDAVLKPDIKTRYEAYRLARQGGWQTANEIRARENLPAVDGGDALQETPVGGAPNTSSTSE